MYLFLLVLLLHAIIGPTESLNLNFLEYWYLYKQTKTLLHEVAKSENFKTYYILIHKTRFLLRVKLSKLFPGHYSYQLLHRINHLIIKSFS